MHYAFGNYLYSLRKAAGLSQKELGKLLGVSDKAVSKWETGSSLPKSGMITAIASLFHLSADELLTCGKTPTVSGAEDSASPTNLRHTRERIAKKKGRKMNLIPSHSTENFDYVCTWVLQEATAEKLHLPGNDVCTRQRDALNHQNLFGTTNLYHEVKPEYRSGLFFLLDDGWDVPYGTVNAEGQPSPFGSCDPNPEKFPGYGKTPEERLKTLSDKVKALGYAGLGLWISTQTCFEDTHTPSPEEARHYWEQRAEWCAKAGIRYWKIDWGRHCDYEYRAMMTECLRKYAPDIYVEHAFCQPPFSQMGDPQMRAASSPKLAEIGDVFRLYDVCKPFKNSSMLCRADEVLSHSCQPSYHTAGILNGETCSSLCAALGLATGIMRFSSNDEAVLRWHRIAPPFSIYASDYKKSDQTLTDYFHFDSNPSWWIPVKGNTLSETAPAVMARGCELPTVQPTGEIPPFVCASRHPVNGACAIATLPRTVDPNSGIIGLAHVSFAVGTLTVPVGIFGCYASLTLTYDEPIRGRVYAQDMLSDTAADITELCHVEGCRLTLDGLELRRLGKAGRNGNDTSEPSLVLTVVP